MHSMPNFAVLERESRHESSAKLNNNKQPCSCQTSLRNLLFHLVQRISLHFKSPDLYLSCTTKVFPKFLLPFQCQASFQSEQFGSYDYAPCLCHWSRVGRVLFVKSGVADAHAKKTPVVLDHQRTRRTPGSAFEFPFNLIGDHDKQNKGLF